LLPIKLHCSVLAASEFTEAIYDYLSKKERQIPKELKAKHRQIEKEKKKTEKRYKEWTKTEEEIHKKEI